MAYDRYDTRNEPRDERSRWRDERSHDRDWNRDSRSSDDRGFFERMGDEIGSWFGSDSDDRRNDERMSRGHYRDQDRDNFDWDRGRREERGGFFGRDRDQDHRHHQDRGILSRSGSSDRDYRRGSSQMRSGGDRGDNWDRERDYRPMTGDYGRNSGYSDSEQFFAASGVGRGGFGRGEDNRSRYERSQSPWGRDEYRRTSFAGSSERSSRDQDPHYSEWRRRHMDELDSDYNEYRREHQSKFESDFGGWREKRQSKRQMLSGIREHMEVVGNDDKHVGTVDRVAGDRIILTKSDPEAGGAHHSLSCSDIDRVDGDKVMLDCSAEQAMHRWRDERSGRALFEREDQGQAGPGILDRSFSGTYR